MRRGHARIDRTEMSLDAANLLFEHLVPKASLELALTSGCCGDIHGFLASSKQNLQNIKLQVKKIGGEHGHSRMVGWVLGLHCSEGSLC